MGLMTSLDHARAWCTCPAPGAGMHGWVTVYNIPWLSPGTFDLAAFEDCSVEKTRVE